MHAHTCTLSLSFVPTPTVSGETNTDDLSPAQDAWSRPDIPLHAVAMLKNSRDGIHPEKEGEIGPLKQIADLQAQGHPLAYLSLIHI